MKKKLVFVVTVLVVLFTVLFVLSACQGSSGSTDDKYRPTIAGIKAKRAGSDYVDEINTLCLEVTTENEVTECEKIEITVTFLNTNKYPFTSIKINDETFTSSSFTSNATNTAITLTYRPNATSGRYKIEVTNVQYKQSSASKKITTLTNNTMYVEISPKFTLTTVIPNTNATGIEVKETKEVTFMQPLWQSGIFYTQSEMNHTDYSSSSLGYCKDNYGFAGWFTEPNGQGRQIVGTSDDKYEFYSNVTLYAYYQPYFTYAKKQDGQNYTYASITGLTNFGKTLTNALFIQESIDGFVVKEIGSSAFQATTFNRIILPDTLEVIGSNAFRESPNLQAVGFGCGIKEIGSYAFFRCKNAKLYIPSTLEKIGDSAFEECGWKTYLSNNAVYEAVGTTSTGTQNDFNILVIPANLKEIGVKAFYGSTFKAIYFLDGSMLTKMGSEAFANSSALETVKTAIRIGGYNYNEDSSLGGLKIIGEKAFFDCPNLTNDGLVLDEGLDTVGKSAFAGTNGYLNIKTLKLPSSLRVIDNNAFTNFKNLESIVFGQDSLLEKIGDYAFERCGLKEVDITCNNLDYYGISPFYGSPNLRVIKLPAAFVSFYGNDELQALDKYLIYLVPESHLEYYRQYWKLGSTNSAIWGSWEMDLRIYAKENDIEMTATAYAGLKYGFEMINGVLTLNYVYKTNHETLTKLDVPDTFDSKPIEAIGPYVVSDSIVEVSLPLSIRIIHTYAFANCYGLTTINLNSLTALEQIGSYAFTQTKITSFVSNNSLHEIGRNAFEGCNKLEYADLNNGSSLRIGYAAFQNSYIYKVRIGVNTQAIGSSAFGFCARLKAAYLLVDLNEISTIASTDTMTIGPFRGANTSSGDAVSTTFALYVINQTVANKLKAASFYSAYNYTVITANTVSFEAFLN